MARTPESNSDPNVSTSFREYVEQIEQDPEQKALLDEERERLRRELDDGDEEAFVG